MEKVKRAFLRACMNYSCLPCGDAVRVLVSLFEAYEVTTDCDLKNMIADINNDIRQFNQKLSIIKHPLVEGTDFLVFSFTYESEVSKWQLHYTEADRHYFLKLMEAIIGKEDYGISWLEIYNNETKLSKQKMQELAHNWTKQGYFLEKNETLYFGPRMLVEYGNHFKTNYRSLLEECPLCSENVFWGVRCENCNKKFHRQCLRTYLIQKSNCCSCKKIWTTRLSL